MSVRRQATRLPLGSTSLAVCSSTASVRAASSTFAPSRSAASTTWRPSPAPTPATSTVLPSRIIAPSLLLAFARLRLAARSFQVHVVITGNQQLIEPREAPLLRRAYLPHLIHL